MLCGFMKKSRKVIKIANHFLTALGMAIWVLILLTNWDNLIMLRWAFIILLGMCLLYIMIIDFLNKERAMKE